MKFSIIIPCYNEEKNLPLILERSREIMTRDDIELVIVNNGSTDGSAVILGKLLPAYPFARSVTVEKNQGYGFGILSGLRAARGEYLGWTHGDLQTSPHDILQAINIIESHGNPKDIYVKGSRKGRPLFDRFFTFSMGLFETFYFGKVLYEINAQPNIFHKSFFEKWENPPHDFALDLYALYMAQRMRLKVFRFPVQFPPRVHGESKWNTDFSAKWKFIQRTLLFSRELKKRMRKEK
jgi:glycosyltransferase involved in cell wall biosynthesis